ncbi:MAG: peptidase dimerization domain-containing protein [Thermomicrobiales bacterium]
MSRRNVVPDVCKIYIDRRALPGDDYEAAIQEVREIAERAIAGIPGASVEVLPRTPVSPAVLADPDSDQVRKRSSRRTAGLISIRS